MGTPLGLANPSSGCVCAGYNCCACAGDAPIASVAAHAKTQAKQRAFRIEVIVLPTDYEVIMDSQSEYWANIINAKIEGNISMRKLLDSW
jgi:hypothetical protein